MTQATGSHETQIRDILEFWFEPVANTPTELARQIKRWFRGGPELDAEVMRRFAPLVERAIAGGLEEWLARPKGWLALILLLDQFTRNAYRNDPRCYSGDHRAQGLATNALDRGLVTALSIPERHFTIMPLVHAEDLACQERGVIEMTKLVAEVPEEYRPLYAMGLEQATKYRAIIARFGRFPHRNRVLGRTSTAEEEEFLRDLADRLPPAGANILAEKYGVE